MLKTASLTLAVLLLSSCTDTIKDAYKKATSPEQEMSAKNDIIISSTKTADVAESENTIKPKSDTSDKADTDKSVKKPNKKSTEERIDTTKSSVASGDYSSFTSEGISFSSDDPAFSKTTELGNALQVVGSNFVEEAASTLTEAETMSVADFQNSGVKFTFTFSYDAFEIDEKSTQELIKHAKFMLANPHLTLDLEGHADERGTREYNLALSENRALSIKEVLTLYDLGSRVRVISFGEEKPISTQHNNAAWQQNRRVELIYR